MNSKVLRKAVGADDAAPAIDVLREVQRLRGLLNDLEALVGLVREAQEEGTSDFRIGALFGTSATAIRVAFPRD